MEEANLKRQRTVRVQLSGILEKVKLERAKRSVVARGQDGSLGGDGGMNR